ncbi:MAG: DUF5106 domain-containing protein [Bacteroidales bacterium]|nr:DUF5106 domain-containing protein [Bacteroidales bacterium]
MNNRPYILLLVLLAAAGCGQKKAERFTALPFPDIALPSMIQSQQDAAEYYAEHFWDNLTDPERAYPSDSILVSGVRKTDVEQRFANWMSILDAVDLKTSEMAIKKLYDKALACERKDTSSNVFETFEALADKYMYDPNSPMRNEEYYLHFAARLASYPGFSSQEQAKYAHRAAGCAFNRLGQKAADFRFADKRGKMHTLHGIDAPYTLLFFSNPGCEACLNIINMLKEEPKISEMISAGTLAVLNIYIDEDLQGWRDYMPIYPEEWYNGFDPDLVIRGEELYSVRAIPSLYLLDKEKRVILKDAPENKMMSYLVNL